MLRPFHTQSHPTMTAVSIEAAKRAKTISGLPGKATAVETSTMGLTAGAANKNVKATPGETPRRMMLPAIGTEAHSQPARPTPATPATGTASAAFVGTRRFSRRSESRWEIAPATSTPRIKKGSDWITMAMNMALQVLRAGESSSGVRNRLPRIRASTATSTSSACPGRHGLLSGTTGAWVDKGPTSNSLE